MFDLGSVSVHAIGQEGDWVAKPNGFRACAEEGKVYGVLILGLSIVERSTLHPQGKVIKKKFFNHDDYYNIVL